MDDDRIELAVVGAGPCGLAILSRLSRDCTSTGTHELGPESAAAILRATVVIDPAGGWLAAWRRKLGSQGVAQLRSPAFVHPHPSRVIDETLRRWADAHGRRAELDAIAAADVADVPRDRPWHTPSAGAFDGFCAGLLAEHGGPVRLRAARVVDVRPLSPPADGFELRLDRGEPRTLRARRVVLAVGDGATPRLPPWWERARAAAPPGRLLHATELAQTHDAPPLPHPPPPDPGGAAAAAAVCHGCAAEPPRWAPPRPPAPRRLLARALRRLMAALAGRPAWRRALALLRALSDRCCAFDAAAGCALGLAPGLRLAAAARPCGAGRLVVVGGGLSAAQLAVHAVHAGWSHVTLLVRSAALEVRPFDISAEWMARHFSCEFSPLERAFYQAEPEGRRALLAAARRGGSVTPAVARLLRELERRGGLRVALGVEADGVRWTGAEWEVRLAAPAAEATVKADAVWLATGNHLDAASVDALRTVRAARPTPEVGGLPVLTPTLRWVEGMELYVCGALSAMQIGPDAFNLAGAGAGAARVVSAILTNR